MRFTLPGHDKASCMTVYGLKIYLVYNLRSLRSCFPPWAYSGILQSLIYVIIQPCSECLPSTQPGSLQLVKMLHLMSVLWNIFLLIPALQKGTFIHWQISGGVTGFSSYRTWMFTRQRDLLWKYAKDLLIFVSHGMKKPYTFWGDLFKMDLKRCQTLY